MNIQGVIRGKYNIKAIQIGDTHKGLAGGFKGVVKKH